MSLFGSLIGGVLGLATKSKSPSVPAAPQAVPLSDFKSALDDPLTNIYAQQALADLGYIATPTTIKGRGMMRVGIRPENKGMYKTNAEVEGGIGNAQAKSEWWGWANEPDKTGWEITEGSEPTAYGRLRENYNNELGAQQAKLLANMTSRGILRSGATADAARAMSTATGAATANAIEQYRQSALDRLNQLIAAERAQQFAGAQMANAGLNANFNNQMSAYGAQQAKRTQDIGELSSILGGISGAFGSRKRTPSADPYGVGSVLPSGSYGYDF